MTYEEFLKTKDLERIEAGFDIPKSKLNKALFPFQRDIVSWALKKGKCAIFSDCGTGKTLMQMEFANQVCKHSKGNALIIAPLAVVEQTKKEGEKFGIAINVCRTQDDVKKGVNITNYEMLEHFTASAFTAVILDESSILKSFTSSTRDLLIDMFQKTPYRLACTATPSPNDHSELGNHAEFLGIMSRTEMLATYFIHDGSNTSAWRLKG
jgi:superfamily II DNA or RNA helicase